MLWVCWGGVPTARVGEAGFRELCRLCRCPRMMLQLGGLAPRASWEGTAWDVSGPPLRDMAPCETAELGAQSAQVTGVGSKPAPEPDSLGLPRGHEPGCARHTRGSGG